MTISLPRRTGHTTALKGFSEKKIDCNILITSTTLSMAKVMNGINIKAIPIYHLHRDNTFKNGQENILITDLASYAFKKKTGKDMLNYIKSLAFEYSKEGGSFIHILLP